MMQDYTCYACHKEFASDRSPEEAREEANLIWGKKVMEEKPSVVICEDCWQENFARVHAEFTKGQLRN